MIEEQKMRSWSKAMGTVLGIVLGSFSIAAIVTLLDETLTVQRQVIPNADSSQELFLSARSIITSSAIGLRVAELDFEQALGLTSTPTQESNQNQTFSVKSPSSSQFLVEYRLASDEVNSLSGGSSFENVDSSHFHNLAQTQPQ